jgi:hypothetical protein
MIERYPDWMHVFLHVEAPGPHTTNNNVWVRIIFNVHIRIHTRAKLNDELQTNSFKKMIRHPIRRQNEHLNHRAEEFYFFGWKWSNNKSLANKYLKTRRVFFSQQRINEIKGNSVEHTLLVDQAVKCHVITTHQASAIVWCVVQCIMSA